MARAIIHIGYPKTATTWFQKSFYPAVRGRKFVDRDRVTRAILEANALTFDAEEAGRLLELGTDEAPIICEEGLSGYLHNGGVNEALTRLYAERLKALFADADIVLFVRAQPAMLASTYQQYVRGGGTHSPRRYLFPRSYLVGSNRMHYKVPLQDLDHFAYQHIVRFYRELFGAGRVHVFAFEEMREEGFATRFADRLGLDVDWDAVKLKPKLRSMSLAAVRIVRFLNLFTYRGVLDKSWLVHIPGSYEWRRRMISRLRRTNLIRKRVSPESLLGPETVRWIEWRYAADNRELAELTGLPLGQLGWVLEAPEAPHPVRESRWRSWYRR